MQFQEYKSSKISHLVISIFERKVTVPLQVTMLPDHTVSLIFNLGEKIKKAQGIKVNSEIFNPTSTFCFITGLHTEPLYFDMKGLHSFGLNLKPSAIRAFWGVPVSEFQDIVVDWQIKNELDFIEDNLRKRNSFQERATWLEDYFLEKLKRVDVGYSTQLGKLMTAIEKDLYSGQRPDIYSYTGYSKMHTNRIFKEWIGLPPGKVLRYRQFLKAIELMHQDKYNLTQIGYSCGFYDQSHFIRVFEEFAKMTPGAYQRQKTPIKGILAK